MAHRRSCFQMLLMILATFVAGGNFALAGDAPVKEAEPPQQFDKYYMVFLMRPDNPPDYGEARNAELQRQHLGHLTWLWEEGYALVAGPFGGDKDDDMRGIVLLRGDLSAERARELAEKDPRVEHGQLKVRIREWYTGKGALEFPLKVSQESPQSGEEKSK